MNPTLRIRPSLSALGVLLLLALCFAPGAGAARYDTVLGSEPGSAATAPSLSGSGRQLAYVGYTAGSPHLQVLVRDLATGAVKVASRAPGHDGALADAAASQPSISRDGRYVAFTSSAANLSPDDQDPVLDVFRRDLATGTTTLVSATAAGVAGNRASRGPDISPDGRYVAFESEADLNPSISQLATNVFVRDLGQNKLTWVNQGITSSSGEGAFNPSISDEGKRVVFDTVERLSLGDDLLGLRDVYMRQMSTGALSIVSLSNESGSPKANLGSHSGAISEDGTVVAFASAATNLSNTDDDDLVDVFVRDLKANQTELLSRTGGLINIGADALSRGPTVSADGNVVAFTTKATNLIYQDVKGTEDVLVFDRSLGSPRLASRAAGASGAGGDADSLEAEISGDGRWVAFSSRATNLVAGAGGAQPSVFLRGLADGSTWSPPAAPGGEDPAPPSGGPGGNGPGGSGGGAAPGLGLRVAAKAKRIGPRAKLVLTYSLARPAQLRAEVARRLPGVRRGGRCVAAGPGVRGARCQRFATVRVRELRGAGGELSLAAPRLGWTPGAYRVTLRASEAGASASGEARVTVTAPAARR